MTVLRKVRLVALLVLLATLGLSALGHDSGALTVVMAVCSVGLAAMSVGDLVRHRADDG